MRSAGGEELETSRQIEFWKAAQAAMGYQIVVLCREKEQKSHSVHVLVAREWLLNPNNKRCVDHIDGDKANNHYYENLRLATHNENNMNRNKGVNKSSIYKGVSIHKQSSKWQAHIRINGESKKLWLFINEREAAETYNEAAREHFKSYARLNIFTD